MLIVVGHVIVPYSCFNPYMFCLRSQPEVQWMLSRGYVYIATI